jgi:dTDP-4-amino-4,6-dideoxygalactose transaminase
MLPGATHVYWKYCLDVDKDITGFDVAQLSQELKNFGIASAPRYIQKPAFRCQVMYDLYPHFQDDAKMRQEYPGSYQALSRVLVLPWNEFYTAKHVDYIADKILQSVEKLSS